MEGEDFPGARIGIAPVREPRDPPGALVDKGQRFGVRDPLELRLGVAFGLQFDRGELGPPTVRFGLDDAYGPTVGEKNVVGRSDVGPVFARCYSDP